MSITDTPATPAEEPIIEGAAPAASQDGQDVNGGPSPQDENKAKPDLLSVVQAAVADPAEAPEASSSSEAEKEGKEATEAEAPKEPTAEEDAALPFGKHPRFKAVLSERNELRGQVATYRQAAEQYERIEQFMQHNDLTNEHVVELFRVGALMRKDPDAAYEAVADVLIELGKQTGRSLPDDLREDVEFGRITEERAAELSRTRARAARLDTQRTEDGNRREADTAAQNVQGIRNAVAEWETRTKAADPDFKVKEKLIADRVNAIAVSEGRPANKDAAVALIARAHREITAELKAARGTRPGIARATPSAPSAAAAPAPKTLHEAISAAVAG